MKIYSQEEMEAVIQFMAAGCVGLFEDAEFMHALYIRLPESTLEIINAAMRAAQATKTLKNIFAL